MTIQLNGDPYEIPEPLSITLLLARLNIDSRKVAVEHNLAIIKRPAYDSTIVHANDKVEIVNFVGGGQAVPPRTDHAPRPTGNRREIVYLAADCRHR